MGGAKEIAKSIIPLIERSGGAVLTQRRVTEILLDNGKAVGVKAQHAAKPQADPEIYRAPIVISDAGALNTYLKLIPPSYPLAERQEMQAFPRGSTAVAVYLGLKESPQKLGFRGENHWIYTTYDHDEIDRDPIDPIAPSQYLPKACYLSFPSLKDPFAQAHTADIIASGDYNSFLQWQEKPWRRRGSDYNELKAQITDSLIQLVESHYPGFQDLIEYAELSTPLTLEHFDASHQGVMYGVPSVPERMDQSWLRTRTPIKNLYLTGADTFALGIMGAMMGGVKTAGLLNGAFGFLRIMATIMLKSA